MLWSPLRRACQLTGNCYPCTIPSHFGQLRLFFFSAIPPFVCLCSGGGCVHLQHGSPWNAGWCRAIATNSSPRLASLVFPTIPQLFHVQPLFLFLSSDCMILNFFFNIYIFYGALGLRCCMWASSSCDERGLLFVAVCGLLIAVASLVAEHGL